jgi:hypothetical protein
MIFSKPVLVNLICPFAYAMWVMGSGIPMLDVVSLNLLKSLGCKLWALVFYHFSWDTKPIEYVSIQEPINFVFLGIWLCFYFYPFGKVAYTDKDLVLLILWGVYWAKTV